MIDKALIAKIDSIKDRVVQLFDAGDWILLENYLDGAGSIISEHPRLLRSLNFGDEDYPACVAEVLGKKMRPSGESIRWRGLLYAHGKARWGCPHQPVRWRHTHRVGE